MCPGFTLNNATLLLTKGKTVTFKSIERKAGFLLLFLCFYISLPSQNMQTKFQNSQIYISKYLQVQCQILESRNASTNLVQLP